MIGGWFNDKPEQAHAAQKRQGVGGEAIRLNRSKFLVLQAALEKAECHLDVLMGALMLPKLKSCFKIKRKDGFVVAYLGTDVKTTFSWREIIAMADGVCFFGEPRGAS